MAYFLLKIYSINFKPLMKLIQTILLLLIPSLTFAQEQYYNILNEDNGLLTNEVYDIHFSKEGFLFISGDKGIQKYDGAKLERILPSWNKSLSWAKDDKYGGVIFQSFDGRYWRYANDSTELIFDNSKEARDKKRFEISQGRYVAFAGRENIYWYDVLNKTIDTVRIHSIKHRTGAFYGSDVISCNEQGVFGRILDTLFFQTDVNGNTRIIPSQQVGDANNLNEIVKYKGQEYFIVKSSGDKFNRTVDAYVLSDGVFRKKFTVGSFDDRRYMNTIRVANNQLFLITANGYWELDNQFQPKYKNAKLPNMAISQIIGDGKGGLYISTLSNGVFYKPSLRITNVNKQFLNQKVKHLDDTRDELFFLNDNGALYSVQQRNRISAVPSNALLKFSEHKFNAQSLLLYGGNTFSNLSNTFSWNNNNWYPQKISNYNKINGWFKNGTIYAGGRNSFGLGFNDTLLANAFCNKYRYRLNYRALRNLRKIFNPISLKTETFFTVALRNIRVYDFIPFLSDESFYIAYKDSLYHYYPKKIVQALLGDEAFEQKHKSRNLEIRHLHRISNGHIYGGGFRGFVRIEKDSVTKYYDAENGLPNNRIEFMKGFGDTILLGFPKAICLFTEEKGIFQTYRSENLFDNGAIRDAHIFKGELYVATANDVFNLPIEARKKNTPKAFIRYVSANGARWNTTERIPFDKNNISIRVNGVNMNSGGAFTYYYRLNENEDWVKQSNTLNDIRFNSLTEGKYNFQLKVVNQWGEESEIVSRSFEIAPPFLRSWPFYLLCLLVAGGITYFIFWRRGKAIRRKAEFDKQVKQSEITAIKAQMNPHFVFNALNSIQNWVITKDVENSNLYLGKFSDLVRKTLEASEKNALPLSKEIEIIQLYLDLENLRFGDKIAIDFDIKISTDRQEEIYIPAMLIQPYIENVFKHGLLHKKGEKKLNVLFEERDGKFYCEIKDNGVGREKAKRLGKKSKKYKSFSTQANRKRIDLLNEIYKNEIDLKISDVRPEEENTGTMIQLWLPIVDYDLQNETDSSQG